MTRLLTLTLLALAALAAPASADTYRTIDYAVTIDGTANYNRADVDEGTTAQHDVALEFQTKVPSMRFVDDVAEDSKGALGTAAVTHGHYVITGETGTQVHCGSHTVGDTTGGGFDATWSQDATTFATRVLDSVKVDVGCGGQMPDWSLQMGSGGQPVGVGIFDGSFTLPHSRIGEATMTFPLSGEVTGAECPFNHFNTALCSLTWDAVVTFVRIGEGEIDTEEDLLVPIVPPDPGAAPTPPPADPGQPVVPGDDLLVPISAKPRLADNLSSAGLPFQCADACKGTLTATAKGKTLAKAPVKAVAGKTVTAKVRFDKRDRKAIRRAKAVKLTLKVKGGGRTMRRSVTLRAR
ncbi:MAG TPA: hypothetical protein VF587_07465 [Solirubrobacteraceae bacterium]